LENQGIKVLEQKLKKFKSQSKLMSLGSYSLHCKVEDDEVSIPALMNKDVKELIREIEKLRNKLLIKSNENENNIQKNTVLKK
jgi:hypothetical protein